MTAKERAYKIAARLNDNEETRLPEDIIAQAILDAERDALELAAQVAIQKGIGNGHLETCASIAASIRALADLN